jgi:thioredoxin:protein disulfide reductase
LTGFFVFGESKMFKKLCAMSLLLSFVTIFAFADEPLLPDEAFQFSYKTKAPDKLLLSWKIADGYYLYKQKVKFIPISPDTQIVTPIFPASESKEDKLFGTVEIYRKSLVLDFTLPNNNKEIEIVYQGCSDVGLCYLPIHKALQ